MLARDGAPRISVIVASQDAEATIVECVGALAREAASCAAPSEIIVADASSDRSRELIAASFPQLDLVTLAPGALVPELWSAGLRVARGEVVALTTAHCVPVAGWITAMINAVERGSAGVGGPIDCDPRASFTDRAIYYTRYSAYLPPIAAGDVADLPGDNAAYDAESLRRFPAYLEGPFWEPFLHADMRGAGLRLSMDPAPIVRYVHSYSATRFIALRFAHGWHFGAVRGRSESTARSFVRAAAFPLVPFVLAARVLGRTKARPAARRRLLPVLPLVVLFFSAFAAGECLAALAGALRGRSRELAPSGAPRSS